MINSYLNKYFFLTLYLFSLIVLGVFVERQSFDLLVTLTLLSFVCYYFLNKEKLSIKEIFIFGIVLRLVFLFLDPTFSDDYFRFIWDGKMVLWGISPFEFLPSDFANRTKDEYLIYLAENMNSANYYSVYPPISQLIYVVAAFFNNELYSIITIRIFLILGDVLAFIYLVKLLLYFNKSEKLVALYFLNPLVIIELTGNLHFEGLMLAFLLMSIYYLQKSKYYPSILFYGLSVGVKLIPLMFLPLMFFKLPKEWKWKYCILVGAIVIIQFTPFVNLELLQKMFSSVNLYFQNFEFNASLYYVFRWIGFQLYGYNVIQTLGIVLGLISLSSIIVLSFLKKDKPIFNTLLVLNSIYLLLSTTIHPWYLILPLAFSLFTNHRFVILWTLMVFLSYSAYQTEIYEENLWLVGLEYATVFCFLLYESVIRKKVLLKM